MDSFVIRNQAKPCPPPHHSFNIPARYHYGIIIKQVFVVEKNLRGKLMTQPK